MTGHDAERRRARAPRGWSARRASRGTECRPRRAPLDHPTDSPSACGLARQEERPDAEGQARLQVQSQPVGIAIEEPVGDLGEEARAVARVVGRGGTAVGHARDRLERHRHDLVRAGAGRAGHEADAAGVVLPAGVERRRGGRTRRGDRDDGNRPGGSAAQWRPWYLLQGEAPGGRRGRRGAKKKPAPSWERAGECAIALAYPAAPMERTRLARTVAGASRAAFMDGLLSRAVNSSSGGATLTA